GDDPDVRLIIKTRKGEPLASLMDMTRSDHRLSLWMEDVPSVGDVFAMADCFVFPSRGEGYGLPPREAAATGMPAIVAAHTGLADGIDNYAIPIRNYQLRPAWGMGAQDDDMLWFEPDIDELTHHMRWCYDNQHQAAEFGLKAATWVRAEQSWARATHRLMELFDLIV
ncbi:MAG: glycosyltransferase, partial [Dehalococcoidia bacterium]|nr:glycosyltransferase [Dehalococcoidia bacterium]